MDDAYRVGFFQKDAKGAEKFVETGFMKVRKVKDQESVSQLLIVTNPKNEKEEDLFNEYDQVYEYPLVGLNIMVGGGVCSFKYWGDQAIGETREDAEENISPFIGINLEYDVAKFINIPELYINVSADILTAQLGENEASPSEEKISTVIAEFGITKKFFTRKLGWYIGGDIGYMALTYTDDTDTDFEYYSVGGKVKGGINYLLSKNLYFDAGAGFRFHGELTDEDGNEGEDGWLTPSGFVLRVGLGYTL